MSAESIPENETPSKAVVIPTEVVTNGDGSQSLRLEIIASDEEALRLTEQLLTGNGDSQTGEPMDRSNGARSFGLAGTNWSNCSWEPTGPGRKHGRDIDINVKDPQNNPSAS